MKAKKCLRFWFTKDEDQETGSEDGQPTMMEKPIGPLMTQLGTGLSFVSQHLRTAEGTVSVWVADMAAQPGCFSVCVFSL